MMARCLRRRSIITSTLNERLVLAGVVSYVDTVQHALAVLAA